MTNNDTTMSSSLELMGKKFVKQLSSKSNEHGPTQMSDFARRQMEKMGWSEGKGLGKNEQGIVSYVRIKRREEKSGVGTEKLKVEEHTQQWWYNAYDQIANKIQIAPDTDDEKKKMKKAKKKQKKLKRKKENEDVDNSDINKDKKDKEMKKKRKIGQIPTDEELFAATGGKLFGRRAYGSCTGKLKRDELCVTGKFNPNVKISDGKVRS